MDRFDVISFSDLSGPDGSPQWVRIGGGSFGVVFKGEYLGTQVAIKEVLPNNTYDVEKYFERECVLMKEARHPNIVQYIGLTKSPGPDGRIYIISEFVGGNLRSFIADTRKPFPWRLRLSFATDIARALAYLHARNCMHRDLKGENLLITANERIKVCDFGFARIAARNEEEMRRISYCGTDGYMSPEILMGVDFSLPSDIFSLGVIFCEILSRHLVDSNTFKREMPSFGINADEVYDMASEGCPEEFIKLALDCVEENPADRPNMREVVSRLRRIESDVIRRELEQAQRTGQEPTTYAVGSLRGASVHAVMGSRAKAQAQADASGSRPQIARGMPSFSGQVNVKKQLRRSASEDSASSDDMEEAIAALEQIGIDAKDGVSPEELAAASSLDAGNKVASTLRRGGKVSIVDTIKAGSSFKVSGHGNPWWSDDDRTSLPPVSASWSKAKRGSIVAAMLADEGDASPVAGGSRRSSVITLKRTGEDGESEYSTSVVRSSKISHAPLASMLSQRVDVEGAEDSGSTLTVKQGQAGPRRDSQGNAIGGGPSSSNFLPQLDEDSPRGSYTTARTPSLANATVASSSIRGARAHQHGPACAAAAEEPSAEDLLAALPTPVPHRFTLVKNGMKRPSNVGAAAAAAASGIAGSAFGSLLPPAIMLTNALAKCWVCGKRIGWKPFLDCDDCPYKTHVACGEMADAACNSEDFTASPAAPARSGSSTPVVSAEQVPARRMSVRPTSPDSMSVSAAAAALRAHMGGAADPTARSATPPPPVPEPASITKKSGGLKLNLRRASVSPPPASGAPLPASAVKKGIRAA